jgi:signal transduction histidine kinase
MVPPSDGRVQIPIERELQERLAWFIRLRWLAAAGIFVGAFAAGWIDHLGVSLVPVYLVGVAVIVYNILFCRYFLRAGPKGHALGRNFIYLQIGLDWLALVFVVHFTGGIRSPVTLAFALHVIIGAILLSRRSCYILATFAVSLIGIVAAIEGLDIWPLSRSSRLLADPVRGIASPFNLWVANAVFFAIIAYLATSITRRLREKEGVLFSSERALDRAYREMEALYQIGQILNSTLEMGEVLSLIAENAARLMGMKACFIRLLDPSGERLFVGGSYGLSQAYIDKGPVDLDKSPIDREALGHDVVQVLEVGDDTRFQYREEAKREGIRSALCAPVTAKNRALGVIRVYSAEPHHFSEQEQTLLKNIANLGALAIVNARAFAELKTLSDHRVWLTRVTHHQLRAPLAAIQGIMDALPYAGELTGKQKELLERGSRRVKDALDMIRDLLDLAAAQRPLEEGAVEDVQLSQALQKVIETARESARGKEVEFSTVIAPPDIVVQAQAADLERIFSNLLDNAVKYTPGGGRVCLEILGEDRCVRAVVSDTGIGIETRDQGRIFDGFYRTQAAKQTGEMGTGLGLSIVKRLVDRYGGRMKLESAPGKGARFTITLPCRFEPPHTLLHQ